MLPPLLESDHAGQLKRQCFNDPSPALSPQFKVGWGKGGSSGQFPEVKSTVNTGILCNCHCPTFGGKK